MMLMVTRTRTSLLFAVAVLSTSNGLAAAPDPAPAAPSAPPADVLVGDDGLGLVPSTWTYAPPAPATPVVCDLKTCLAELSKDPQLAAAMAGMRRATPSALSLPGQRMPTYGGIGCKTGIYPGKDPAMAEHQTSQARPAPAPRKRRAPVPLAARLAAAPASDFTPQPPPAPQGEALPSPE